MAKRLMSFWNKNKVLYSSQFGFRSKHSTTMALINTIDEIYENLDNGNYALGVFLDLQKAFDTVNHSILLNKLYYYGIRGSIHEWFKSYLSNRCQYTVVNNVSSNFGNITCGVPQGSVRGPLLFLIYMTDLQNIPKLDAHPKLFADDTNVFVYAKNLTALNTKGMLTLELISEWMTANKLSINYCISCYMMFSFSKVHDFPNNNINLSIYGHTLAQVRSTKYLGLNVDENLNWKGHIKDVYNNIIKYTSIFYKLRSKLPVCVLKQLYFATIYPALLYGIELYANTYSSYLSGLHQQQPDLQEAGPARAA